MEIQIGKKLSVEAINKKENKPMLTKIRRREMMSTGGKFRFCKKT